MLKKMCLAVALASALPAIAADYYVVTPMPGKLSAISVALNAYTLPAGQVGESYSFNLATLLQVTGDSAYDPNQAQWAITEGSLPNGLSLNYGQLVGTPQPTAAGQTSAFTVTVTYKTKAGSQSYSIPVVMPAPTVAVTGWAGAAPDGDFGSRTIGAGGAEKFFYLLNQGAAGAIEGGFTLTGSPAFSVTEVSAVDRVNEGGSAACDSATATSRAGCKLADASSGYYAKKNLQVKVKFAPTAPGPASGALTFSHNGNSPSPVTINLSGLGAEIQPSTSITGWAGGAVNGAFGSRTVGGGYEERYFYVRNNGTQGKITASVELSGSSAFSLAEVSAANLVNDTAGVNCAGSTTLSRTDCVLADAASGYYATKHFLVKVRFTPSTVGNFTGQLKFTHNGTSGSPVTIDLAGTGAEIQPSTSITGWGGAAPNGAFGQRALGSYHEQYYYIENTGTQGRIIADAEVTGSAFQITEIVAATRQNEGISANCQGTGNVRTGCTMADAASGYYAAKNLRVKVRFGATTAGQYTGTLTFKHNGTSPSPVTINLTGEAMPVAPTVQTSGWSNAPASGVYGDVQAGATKDLHFFLKNTGSAGAIKASMQLSGDPRFTVLQVNAVNLQNEGNPAGCVASTALSRTDCQMADANSGYYATKHFQVIVRFNSTSPGAATGTLTFNHNGTGVASPVSFALSANGL